MSLRPEAIPLIPEETWRVARAAFPRGNTFMQMRDKLGVFYRDEDFAALFPIRGQPAVAPWRLALVLVLQYVKVCRIAKWPRPCGAGSIGNTSSA